VQVRERLGPAVEHQEPRLVARRGRLLRDEPGGSSKSKSESNIGAIVALSRPSAAAHLVDRAVGAENVDAVDPLVGG
jgi:hypothetical protein